MLFVSSTCTQRCFTPLVRSLGIIFKTSTHPQPVISGICRSNQRQHESVRKDGFLWFWHLEFMRCFFKRTCFKPSTSLSEGRRYEKRYYSFHVLRFQALMMSKDETGPLSYVGNCSFLLIYYLFNKYMLLYMLLLAQWYWFLFGR